MKYLLSILCLFVLSCDDGEDVNSFLNACDDSDDIVIYNDAEFYCGDLFVLRDIKESSYHDEQHVLDIGGQYWEGTRLIELQIIWNDNLTGLPDDISNLSYLEELILNYNNLRGLPESIGDLTSLQKLDLEVNELISLPVEICNLPDECYIDVGWNDLCEEYHFDCIDDWGGQSPLTCP